MKNYLLLLLPLAIPLLYSGCEPSCEKLSEQTPSIELGTGPESFESISEGEALEPGWGNQGGQHIWSSLRVSGVHRGSPIGTDDVSIQSRPTVRFAVESGESILALYRTENQLIRRSADGGEVIGATAFIDFNPYSTPQFFPEDFDVDDWQNWEEGEEEAAWDYAIEVVENTDWQFNLTLTDSCGTEVSDSRSIRIEGLDRY